MSETKLFEVDTWAVVEVMGHNTFAGKISEHVVGGTAFIRVDVPELPEKREPLYQNEYVYPGIPAFTKLIGASSIYAITPCTEEVARKMAESRRSSPVHVVDVSPKIARIAIAASTEETTVAGVNDDDWPF